jgi:hypothetical protein
MDLDGFVTGVLLLDSGRLFFQQFSGSSAIGLGAPILFRNSVL